MRLFEAIVEANHRASAGDKGAGLCPADFAASLPVVALTCIDPRLNPLMPAALGIREEDFIWLRNAGNIVTGPLSSTLRSLALACAIKGGKEIAVIGHTDCRVRQTTVLDLVERFRTMGIERSQLPNDLNEYFGLFASERQNVLKATEMIRRSPLIGPSIPVHGLLVDVLSGQLEWLVNGYEIPASSVAQAKPSPQTGTPPEPLPTSFAGFDLGNLKFPETKIGERPTTGVTCQIGAVPEAGPTPVKGLQAGIPFRVGKGAPPASAPSASPVRNPSSPKRPPRLERPANNPQ